MLASDFFTPARLKEMRDEIHREGFVADKFLADNPDCSVFGFNLACLYPFPETVRALYEPLSQRLGAIDPGVYVYPIWETHVTIATFINFTRHRLPTPESIAELKVLTEKISDLLEPAFCDIGPFELSIEQPVISRKAAILPLSDLSDGISRIRNKVAAMFAGDAVFRTRLEILGLNIPPLVHSTIMRFKSAPQDSPLFLSRFDEISGAFLPATVRVNEVYITTETKPYMREGEIFRRFQL